MTRVYNFSAGPAVLPEEVLQQAAAEMLDYQGCGMSVMEMSHRSKEFKGIIETAEADLRELMGIPENYRVLFLQGGASQQFAAIPMNLMTTGVADYVVSGSWSKKAWKEAKKFGDARCIASSEDETFSYVPDVDALEISDDASYVYICENETIYGTKYHRLPDTKGKPLVADVSSCFLSEPMEVERYGLIYGGVQKNVGPAGVVIVIVRDDLVPEEELPTWSTRGFPISKTPSSCAVWTTTRVRSLRCKSTTAWVRKTLSAAADAMTSWRKRSAAATRPAWALPSATSAVCWHWRRRVRT